MSVRDEIERRTGRDVSVGAVYTTLERLSRKGLVTSRYGEPTSVRGGRRKRLYRMTPRGEQTLGRAYKALQRMMEGLETEMETLNR